MKILTNYATQTNKNYPIFTSRKTNDSCNTSNADNSLILITGCDNVLGNVCVKKMSESEKFALLKDTFWEKVASADVEYAIGRWNFYTNSTSENMQKLQDSVGRYHELFRDEKTFDAFSHIDKTKLSEHDAKILTYILKNFDEEINAGHYFKSGFNNKTNEISQKFNNYVMKIDNIEVSNAEITKILETETDPEIRKKAYDAKVKRGDLIAEDLRELVRMRNDYAKKQGYDNYFDYSLKEEYDVEPEFLDDLLNQVYTKVQSKLKKNQNKYKVELEEFYGTKNLEAHHYGLLLDSNPAKAVNEKLEKLAKENSHIVEEISKKAYQGMGYNIQEMLDSGKITLDLYPRKNKNTGGLSVAVDYGKDVRILANLNNDLGSIETLCHEMGHAVYDLGISEDLQFFDKDRASYAMTEAVAMMMGDLVFREDILRGYISSKELKNLKKSFVASEVNFISRCAMYIEFEREMYKNPDKDPAQIWQEKNAKYRNRIEKANNEWATIPHFLTHPVYYQNYFRATLMKAQIYKHLMSRFGDITENKKVADYLNKELFSYGATVEEYDLIKQLTGKDFSADDFVKSI